MRKLWALLIPLFFCGMVQAEDQQYRPFSIGVGASLNSLDGFEDAAGYQVFAGYIFDYRLGPLVTAVEAGYMDSGEYDLTLNLPGMSFTTPTVDARGVWVSANVIWPVNESIGVVGRAGYDFGDDEGVLLGIGVEFVLAGHLDIRGEFVSRQETESLQLNLIYYAGWFGN